jgi:Flp pilus assembly protein TadG
MKRDREAGATAVEFAIVFPVVLMFILFAMYGGFIVFYGAVADHVARTVVRQVSIPTSSTGSTYPDQGTSGGATVRDDANKAASGLLPGPTDVSVTSARDAVNPGDEVTVTVTYKPGALGFLSRVMWFLPDANDSITRTATARRE